MNVDEDATGLPLLRRLGVPGVPAVVTADDRVTHGWNPQAYARLLGVDWKPTEKLSPPALAARLDTILDLTQSLLRDVPDDKIDWRPPERDRTLRNLGYHVFRLSLAFPDGMDLGSFPEGWLQEKAPADLRDGAAIARYGALVRGRLSGWFQGAAPSEFDRTIAVYYGPQSAHELLERTTWHAAQHLRQLYHLMDRLELPVSRALPAGTFDDLPLPAAMW